MSVFYIVCNMYSCAHRRRRYTNDMLPNTALAQWVDRCRRGIVRSLVVTCSKLRDTPLLTGLFD